MEFFFWFYSEGIQLYTKHWLYLIALVSHNFSPILLIKTILAPWKKLVIDSKTSGFNPSAYFQKVTFNIYSRLIGATVRLLLLFVGLIVMLLVIVGGAVGLLIWITIPPLSFSYYKRSQKSPSKLVHKIRHAIETHTSPVNAIFRNQGGEFILSHVGLKLEDLITLESTNFKIPRNVTTFKGVVESFTRNTPHLEYQLNTHSLMPKDLVYAAEWWDKKREEESYKGEEMYFGRPGIGLELLFGYTPELNTVTKDLALIGYEHHLIGRNEVIKRIERVLTSGKSVILRGIPGVGKKTVVTEFAYKASVGMLGPKMAYRRIVELDINKILSATTDINQKKNRLQNVLAEASAAGNIILVINDIERVTNASVEGYDFTTVFESVLSRDLKIIASVGEEEYERYIVPNTKISKYFEPVEVTPPTKEEAMSIILESAHNWEKKKRVTILVPALRQIIDGSDRYITDTPFPEKALEILDQVMIAIDGRSIVTVDDVNKLLEEKTGVPFSRLNQEEKTKLGDLEKIIHEGLINQENAIKLIAQSLRARSSGLKDESRPIGSFLFLGPTGVGKTETAKVLSRVYYGDEKNILRFDMAEYASSDGLARLIGSVSRNIPGVLTTAIKNKPASLLLLDEIEKAPSEIKNVFLTMLDEGFITDSFGKKINCQNLLIIATSNAGAEYVRQLVSNGIKGSELQKEVMDEVQKQKFFSPEFLNRFDGVVVYEPLTEENLILIAHLMLRKVGEKLKKRNIYFDYPEETVKKLANEGYDPAFGARPMRRIVDLMIGDVIGSAILSGKIHEGETLVLLPSEGENKFTWEVKLK